MATAQSQPRPGFFHLGLNSLNTRDLDRRGIEQRVTSLQQQLVTRNPGIETALRNLLGILLYGLGRYEEALQQFEAALDARADNLNALEHCIAVSAKLGKMMEETVYKQRLQDVDRSEELIGLMLLEQAYARTFEVYRNADKNRYVHALELYAPGLAMTKQRLSAEDRVEWMICYGCAYNKLLDVLWSSRDNALIKKSYSEALKLFDEACQYAIGLPSEYLCWSYLGHILSKPPKNERNIDREFLDANGLTQYLDQPEQCFEKALTLKPNDKETTCRYATYILRIPHTSYGLQRMRHHLNAVIQAQEADLNWFPYALRGRVLLASYEINPTEANKAYLRQALEDYQEIDGKRSKTDKNEKDIAKIKRYLSQ